MEKGYRICLRCCGRKKVFKIGGGYSHINTGGIEVGCPLCLAKGQIKHLDKAIVDVTQALINTEKVKKNDKKEKTRRF